MLSSDELLPFSTFCGSITSANEPNGKPPLGQTSPLRYCQAIEDFPRVPEKASGP